MFSTSFPQAQINRAREYLGGTKHYPGGAKLLILALVGLCLFSFAGIGTAKAESSTAGDKITNVEVYAENGRMWLEFDTTDTFELRTTYHNSLDRWRFGSDVPYHYLAVKNDGTNGPDRCQEYAPFHSIYPEAFVGLGAETMTKVFDSNSHYKLLLHFTYWQENDRALDTSVNGSVDEIIQEAGVGYDSACWDSNWPVTIEAGKNTSDDSGITTFSGNYFTPKPAIDNFSYTSLDELPVTVKWHYINRPAGADTANMTLAQDDHNRSYDVDFSISTTTTSGTSTFQFPPTQTGELTAGTYDQNECVFSDISTAPGDTSVTGNLCPDFSITISTGTEPTLPVPEWPEVSTTTAEDFYSEHSDYATPTPAFNVIFDGIEPAYQWIKNITDRFKGFFQIDEASNRGEQMGDAIATARAYADSLDAFLGGVPISWALMIYITIALVIMVYRIIRGLIQTFKPM